MSERRWAVLDWTAAVVLGAWSTVAVRNGAVPHISWVFLEACAALASVPIGLRRRWPLPVLAVVTGATAVLTFCGRAPLPVDILLALAGYTVVTQESRRFARRGIVGAEAILAGALVASLGAFRVGAFGALIPLVAAWFVGDSVAARRAYLVAEAEQARQRGVIEAQRARQTLRDERMAIARELHDVVAHSLTVITVQAGVGRRLVARQPDQAGTTLRSIEEQARTAQEELGVVLGLLRDGPSEGAELAPAPGLADLEALAETMRAVGTPVALRKSGSDRRLSPALELTIYRIVQEALTNVARHAPGARAAVEYTVSAQSVSVVVANDSGSPPIERGSEPPMPSGSQQGIAGMRERVAAFGGSLQAELLPGQGFRISVVIPLTDAP